MERITLEPVDGVEVTTVVDNSGGIFEKIIPQTAAALASENPGVLVPAHCTGWKAQHALAAALPGAFRPNSVGSRFEQ